MIQVDNFRAQAEICRHSFELIEGQSSAEVFLLTSPVKIRIICSTDGMNFAPQVQSGRYTKSVGVTFAYDLPFLACAAVYCIAWNAQGGDRCGLGKIVVSYQVSGAQSQSFSKTVVLLPLWNA